MLPKGTASIKTSYLYGNPKRENLLAHARLLAYEGRQMVCQQAKRAAKLLVFAGHLAY